MEPAQAQTNPAAGWFADPHVPNFLRWWDGFQWTHHVHPMAPADAPAHAHAQADAGSQAHGGAQASGFTSPTVVTNGFAATQATGQQFPTHNAHPASSGALGIAATATTAGTSAIPSSNGEESLLEANPKSMTAIVVSAIYLAMAIATGVVLAGVVPAILTLRAFERREKLAPAALVAAVIAIGFAFTHMHATR